MYFYTLEALDSIYTEIKELHSIAFDFSVYIRRPDVIPYSQFQMICEKPRMETEIRLKLEGRKKTP